jgi:hypothetical protein
MLQLAIKSMSIEGAVCRAENAKSEAAYLHWKDSLSGCIETSQGRVTRTKLP